MRLPQRGNKVGFNEANPQRNPVEIDPRTSHDLFAPLLIAVLHSVSQALPAVQRESIAAALADRAMHLNETAIDGRAVTVAAMLSACAEIARGHPADGAVILEFRRRR